MSDAVQAAIIGLVGTALGAVGTVIAARIQASRKAAHVAPPEKAETTPVLGEAVDIRELRVLRALFGEPKGRILEAYRHGYYGSTLDAVIRKGWVKRIEDRYYMTPKGAAFCRAYVSEILGTWEPSAQILA